jgi:hypothetical protein
MDLFRSRASAAATPATPAMASFASKRAVPPTDLLGWAGLSMSAKFAKKTGSTLLDEHNDGLMMALAYLNGCAIAADSDEETAYLLRLRADISNLIINPEDLAALDAEDDPEGDVEDDPEADADTRLDVMDAIN